MVYALMQLMYYIDTHDYGEKQSTQIMSAMFSSPFSQSYIQLI